MGRALWYVFVCSREVGVYAVGFVLCFDTFLQIDLCGLGGLDFVAFVD